MDGALECKDSSHSFVLSFPLGIMPGSPRQSVYDESLELRNVDGCNYRLDGVRCPRSLWHVPRVLRSHPPAAKSRSSSQARNRAGRLTPARCSLSGANGRGSNSSQSFGLASRENRQLTISFPASFPPRTPIPSLELCTPSRPRIRPSTTCQCAVRR